MKKVRGLLLSITLLSGFGIFGLFNNQNEDIRIAEASRATHTTGFYEKVNDISRLEDGDKVLIGIYNSQFLAYFGGNPASGIFVSDGVYFSYDYQLVGVEDSSLTEFTLGYNSSTNQYTFRGSMEMTSSKTYDVLIAYNPDDYNTGFDAIGSFTGDSFGAYVYNNSNLNSPKTHWTLTNSGKEGENINLTNCYNSGCSRDYAIYRKAVSKSFYGNDYHLTYRNYYYNEKLNPHGFYVEVMDNLYSDYIQLYYQDNANMFYFVGNGLAQNGVTVYSIKLHGLNDIFTFEVNEPMANPNYYYEYVTPTMLKDYRGTYLAVAQEEGTRYYNGRNPEYIWNKENSTEVTIDHELIANDSYFTMEQGIIIDRVEIDGKMEYVAKTKDIFPMYYNNPYYEEFNIEREFIELTDTYSKSNIITIKENPNGGMTFGFTSKYDEFFGFSYDTWQSNFFFETQDNYQNARLYKINKTDYFDSGIASFISVFEQQTENCDPTGNSRTVFEYQWGIIEMEFNSLVVDAKGYLANLTYTHNGEQAHTIEDIIDRYDFILSKYPDLNDFIGRKEANTWVDSANTNHVRLSAIKNDNTAIVITIITIAVLSTSFVTLVAVKKKKR